MAAVRATNRKSSGSDPFAVALRLLTGRDLSRYELRQRLLQRGFDEDQIEDALRRCSDFGYLDDRRYAINLAQQLATSGRAVGQRARLELQRRGLTEVLIEEALAAAEQQTDQETLLRELLQRRWPEYNDNTVDERQKRRIIAWFQRRGFPLARVFNVLKQTVGSSTGPQSF